MESRGGRCASISKMGYLLVSAKFGRQSNIVSKIGTGIMLDTDITVLFQMGVSFRIVTQT